MRASHALRRSAPDPGSGTRAPRLACGLFAAGVLAAAVAACGSDHASQSQCATCDARTPTIAVRVSVAACPSIVDYALLPTNVPLGGSSQLAGYATSPGQSSIVYAWTASAGHIDSPSSPNTSLLCTVATAVKVTLTASDPTGACSDTISGVVQCLGPPSGDAGDDGDGAPFAPSDDAGSTGD